MTYVKGAKRNIYTGYVPSAPSNTARFRDIRREIELPSSTAKLGPGNWISRKLDRSSELFSNGLFIFSATRRISYFARRGWIRKTKWIGAISTLRVWKIHLEYFEIFQSRTRETESSCEIHMEKSIHSWFIYLFFFVSRKIIAGAVAAAIISITSRGRSHSWSSLWIH